MDRATRNLEMWSIMKSSMSNRKERGAFPEWEANVFVMDDQQAPLHVPENKGHESMAYLTYIIDHYDDLPDYLVFSHAERWQWHNDDPMYDGIPVIRKLQLPYVNKVGYTNLRCAWKLGCPVQVKPGRILSKIEAAFEPWNERANTEAVFGRSFRELFPDAEVPSAVGVPCGGQFAVARWKVLERPRGDYERFREWLLGTALPDSVSGRVLEYSWHSRLSADYDVFTAC
ncbi:MAG: hypothetical protein M1828_006079 [Chrysothrix sp. TS-e1954]|nr:MAG: hypothetical protein M1828_006079 [Chrysothrix sp. TS-e1954]